MSLKSIRIEKNIGKNGSFGANMQYLLRMMKRDVSLDVTIQPTLLAFLFKNEIVKTFERGAID